MEDGPGRRVVAGVLLIVVGAGMLALQLLEGVGRGSWLLFLGGLFIAAYVYRRSYGFLVAGCILLGVGVGQVGEDLLDLGSGVGSVGIGLGFITIYLIDRANRRSAPWWPLIPGGILVVTGLSDLGEPIAGIMDYVWPAALIVIGLALVFGLSRRRDGDRPEP